MVCIFIIIRIPFGVRPTVAPRIGGHRPIAFIRLFRAALLIIIGFLPRIVLGFTSFGQTAIGFLNSTFRLTFRVRPW